MHDSAQCSLISEALFTSVAQGHDPWLCSDGIRLCTGLLLLGWAGRPFACTGLPGYVTGAGVGRGVLAPYRDWRGLHSKMSSTGMFFPCLPSSYWELASAFEGQFFSISTLHSKISFFGGGGAR